jgi:hypothetical protein
MLLNEFFGKSIKLKQDSSNQDDKSELNNELFWFILDHDRLHKEYFMPLAKKIKESDKAGGKDKEHLTNSFMPMVEKACKEYYAKKKMTGKLGKVFPKDLREEMCERLYDHYRDDVLQDKYKLG